MKVAVIGAGCAGLIAARIFSQRPQDFEPHVFEKTDTIGGLWVYKEKTGLGDDGEPIHCAIYKNLLTDLPRQLMEFPDYPFPADYDTYLHHPKVRDYLESYANHFDLKKYIRFNTRVTSVHRLDSGTPNRPRWLVTSTDRVSGSEEERREEFDAVIVCSGHFVDPYYPEISGLDHCECKIIHSRDYRVPEEFRGKRVLMVGAMTSGLDITRELHLHAASVTVAVGDADVLNARGQSRDGVFPANVSVVSFPASAEGKTFSCRGGERVEVDAVILCTGYQYRYPFLDESCEVSITEGGKRVGPLYRHMVHARHHTLIFSVLPTTPSAFTLPYVQIAAAAKILDGSLAMPSEEAARREAEEEHRARIAAGQRPRHAHSQLFPPPYDPNTYARDLAAWAKVAPLSEEKFKDVVESLDYLNRIRRNFMDFRVEQPVKKE
ncbi:PREDICTED: flavin-containing monooxygenase FMO GS-OX-like 2 [Priapulus caudatus]|uniref:Flavin-containing monooxygenase n=1 Tax=Priapulus caudatus TaxID=37621 RepID=A0ABM1EA04_PRICU|nr:PREDICTED: flavin-containing monooxygenase FMO GS-OX-like 2 [Priapulus caudatus]